MIKFLAILKDSVKEARSGWVLQAMMILSFIVLVLVASISFKPTTVKAELESGFGFFNRLIRTNPEFKTLELSIENYSESNPSEPWKSDYAFDFVVKTETAEQMKKIKENRGIPVGTRNRAEKFVRQSLTFLDKVEVEADISKDPTILRYPVKTMGTKTPDQLSWRHTPSVLFWFEAPLFPTSLREGVYYLQNYLIGGVGAWIVLLLSVIITAGFVPNMLQKGTVDLAISKPISRTTLLIYKYIGGMSFMVLLTTFLIGGTWLTLGLRNGLWSPNILLAIPILTFYFAIMYAVSTLVGVLTRSPIVSILATLLAWGLFFGIGKLNDGVMNRLAREAEPPKELVDMVPKPGETPDPPDPDEIMQRLDPDSPLWGFIPKWMFTPIRIIHAPMPRTYQLDDRLSRLIARGVLSEPQLESRGFKKPAHATWAEILGVCALFITVMLGLGALRFSTRDL